ncbi:hypothetical protein G4O51_03715 [Candidatus Bathyarchaeota archaeon A05DMB-2]|jgi:hypothetical protein|nr:hypothetical protein [Candidatus Bathyarchaeota archaeon A05DMB-2]
MDKVRLILTVITIVIIAVPLVGTLLANQGNLLGLIIPPEANEIIDTLSSGGGGSGGPQMEPVGEPQYDPASRTFSQTIQFTNTFPFDITVNSMSGDVLCVAHGFTLGIITLDEPVSIPKGETKTLTVLGTWTEGAIAHFQTAHADEAMVPANLVGFTVDVKGIQVQMDQTMEVPNPAYKG